MIPALLGAATIGASLFNTIASHNSQKDLRATQLQLYEQQRKDTLDLMNRQNAYNSPAQQMERLREAGLNPHLIYSGGATNPSVSASPAPPPQLQPINKYFDPQGFQAASQIYLQLQSLELQNKNLDLQNRGLEADVKLKERQGNLLDEQAISEITNRQNTISQTELNYQAYKFNSQLRTLEVEMQSLDYKYKKILYPLQEINAVLQNEKERANIVNVKTMTLADKLLKGAQLEDIKAKVKLSIQEYNFLEAVNDYRITTEALELGVHPLTDEPIGIDLKTRFNIKNIGEMVSSFIKIFGK